MKTYRAKPFIHNSQILICIHASHSMDDRKIEPSFATGFAFIFNMSCICLKFRGELQLCFLAELSGLLRHLEKERWVAFRA